MSYVIVAVTAAILILPLVYELPNYVYERKQAILPFLRWPTPVYIALFFVLLGVLIGDGILMLKLTLEELSFRAIRIWIGIVVCVLSVAYFSRIIPIYYDENFDIRSESKQLGTLVRELVAIGIFGFGLFFVSVYVWSFCLDAGIILLLTAARVRRYLRFRRKSKDRKGEKKDENKK